MSKKKILALALAVCMLAVVVVGASLAYFNDRTETAQNVFTLGNVKIKLDEGKFNKETKTFDAQTRVLSNDYGTLMPGTFYDKDPTITVEEGSEDCWVFAEIEFSRYVPMIQYLQNTVDGFATMTPIQKSVALTGKFLEGFENAKWKIMNPEVLNTQPDQSGAWPGTIKLILGYQNETKKAGEKIVIFTKAGLPADLDQTNASLFFNTAGVPITGPNQIKLNITAAAIQAEGLTDIDAAYTALYPATNP